VSERVGHYEKDRSSACYRNICKEVETGIRSKRASRGFWHRLRASKGEEGCIHSLRNYVQGGGGNTISSIRAFFRTELLTKGEEKLPQIITIEERG